MRRFFAAILLLVGAHDAANAARALIGNDADYLSVGSVPCPAITCSLLVRFNPGTLPSQNGALFIETNTTSAAANVARGYVGGSGGAEPQIFVCESANGVAGHQNPTANEYNATASWSANATSIAWQSGLSNPAPQNGWTVFDVTLHKTIGTVTGYNSGTGALGVTAAAFAFSAGTDLLIVSPLVTLNAWQLGGCVWTGTASLAYVNGALVGSNSNANTIPSGINSSQIGAENNNGIGFAYNGSEAEVAVYPCALTSGDETTAQNSSGIPFNQLSLSCAPAAYWPLYGTTSPEPDFSGNGNAMSITGSVPYAQGPWLTPSLGGM